MTRTVFLFQDGTCRVNGIDADALGEADDLPFLTECARIEAAKSALAQDDLSKAKNVASRQVVSSKESGQVIVRFVSPPDWDGYGDALWNLDNGETHSVSGLTNDEALRVVRNAFPDAQTSVACINWYRHKLRQSGEAVLTSLELRKVRRTAN